MVMSNLQVTKDNVIKNRISAALFKAAAEEVMPSVSPSCIERVHYTLVSKVYNCRCNEYINSINQANLIRDNKTFNACIGLRDKLKLYASEKLLK